jgi:RNA polymerase sigma-70 factor (ECF subfamily)
MIDTDRGAVVERIFREVHGQAIATLVRVFGDITVAEDAVQDAFVVATERWPGDGVPANPAGWIITTARNRGVDVLRRSSRGIELQHRAVTEAFLAGTHEPRDEGTVEDDQLRLVFTCCHPALRPEHRIALTLRLLGGLSVEEIARSFLVSVPAMEKRLVRAKYKIRAANIPYRVPSDADLPERLHSVLSVVYLIYNTGADDHVRQPLREDAFRLARALVALMPDEPEAKGLLALLLLNESRMAARTAAGDVVLLRDQNRGLWDRSRIEEGLAIVRACIERNRPGPYQLQAAIQAVHCKAASFRDTDWNQIVLLYDHLMDFTPTPIVALNRAIAVGERDGPEAGLAAVDANSADLSEYHLMHAARASMLQQLGQNEAARVAFEEASRFAVLDSDRRFLAGRIRDLTLDPR